MVGAREVIAGGAAPHWNECIKLVGQHHVEAGPARRLAIVERRTSIFLDAVSEQ